MLLTQNLAKKTDDTTSQQTLPAMSAESLLTEFIKPGAIPSLGTESYTTHKPQGSYITVKADGQPYEITVQTPYDILYTANTADTKAEDNSITSQVKEFAKARGLQAAQSLQQNTASASYTLFKNSSAWCEFTSTQQITDQDTPLPNTYLLACVDKKLVDSTYQESSRLLALYAAINPALKTSRTSLLSETKDDVSYTILRAQNNDSTSLLLFGTVQGATEFIANLAEGDITHSNSKYIVTPETRAKISNPKYKGYLLQQIAGVSG